MKRALTAILLFIAVGLQAATTNERITPTLTITNVPVTSNSLYFNTTFREWTNANSSTTILTNLQGTAWATTNLLNNIASYPYAGGPWALSYAASNAITIVGPVGTSLTATQGGNWCTLTLTTQSVVRLRGLVYPFNGLYTSNATDQATEIVTGINTFATNAFETNASAMGNFLRKTNSYGTNIVLDKPTLTNAVNRGNAFSSVGIGANSEQFGSGALALGEASLAIGYQARASNYTDIAIGNGAYTARTQPTPSPLESRRVSTPSKQALAQYEKTVLTALREVEDSLVSVRTARDQNKAQQEQVNALQSALRLAELRYKGGLANYLDVLVARRNLFEAELAMTGSRRLHLVSVVQVYKALGGGWSPDMERVKEAGKE